MIRVLKEFLLQLLEYLWGLWKWDEGGPRTKTTSLLCEGNNVERSPGGENYFERKGVTLSTKEINTTERKIKCTY